MKKGIFVCLLAFAVSGILYAAEYRMSGDRIEKGSSTWGYARQSGDDYRIEKGSSTVGYAKKRNSKWSIEDTGSNTLGWLNGNNIETAGGSSWASLSEAKSFCDGPDPVAAAMWVLNKKGKL
jgi:hypothetical protein